MSKTKTSIYLSSDAKMMLDKYATKYGLNQTEALEKMIRAVAQFEGLTEKEVIPEMVQPEKARDEIAGKNFKTLVDETLNPNKTAAPDSTSESDKQTSVISASGAADPSHVQIIVPNDAIIKQWTQQYMADADPEERKAYAKTQENYVKRKQEWEEAERKRDFIIETKRRIQEAVEEEKTKGEQDRAHIRASYSTRKPEINFPEKDGPVIVMDKPRKRVYDR